jgi:hypothetical protein
LVNFRPLQKEHFRPPLWPVPLQKEQLKLEVPAPLHVAHTLVVGGAGVPGLGAGAGAWPLPPQLEHLPNIRPLQKEHLNGPFFPEPLQNEHTNREVPEPPQVPQLAAWEDKGSAPKGSKKDRHTSSLKKARGQFMF